MEQLQHANNTELIATITDKLATEALPKHYGSLTNIAVPCPGGVMLETNSLNPTKPEAPARQLKIEAAGDFWRGLIIPKIRLAGQWLERAGFSPGSHVHVTCLAPGVIELRSREALTTDNPKPLAQEYSDDPF